MNPKPKKRKSTMPRLKVRAWDALSKWIRIKAADPSGIVRCVTCGSRHFWKDIQGGHYIHGHSKPTYMVEMNVHSQCVRCNHHLSGNLQKYQEFMLKTYGAEKVEDLRQLSHKIYKPTRDELEALIEKYKIEEI